LQGSSEKKFTATIVEDARPFSLAVKLDVIHLQEMYGVPPHGVEKGRAREQGPALGKDIALVVETEEGCHGVPLEEVAHEERGAIVHLPSRIHACTHRGFEKGGKETVKVTQREEENKCKEEKEKCLGQKKGPWGGGTVSPDGTRRRA